jgi:hypothetical protein
VTLESEGFLLRLNKYFIKSATVYSARAIGLALALTLTACKPQVAEDSDSQRGQGVEPKNMQEIRSGYSSTSADWLAFLQCWRGAVDKRLGQHPNVEGLRALPPSVNTLQADMASTQSRDVHFLAATEGRGWCTEVEGYDPSLGMPRRSLWPIGMEAWILSFKIFAKRYRSFAELMQEMAFRDVNDNGRFFVPSGELATAPCTSLKTAALAHAR